MSDWKLAGEHVAFKRPLEAPAVLRPLLERSLYRVSYYLILSDPALSASRRWLGLYEATADNAVQWLQAYTDTTPKMVRYYLPAAPGSGFRAETPIYEGHWRATRDEQSELPWPVPDPQWTDRAAFSQTLVDVEDGAHRVDYRGSSSCRLCGQKNGHEGLRLERWEWPAGYRHYIAEHGVRPSAAFQAFIEGVTAGRGPKR